MDNASKLLSLMGQQPDAVRLARVASLASRVELTLLRRLRRAFVPASDAGLEADLQFGALTLSHNASSMVLRPEVVDEFREQMRSAPDGPTLLEGVWNILQEAHSSAPPLIQLEEKVTILGLRGEENNDEVEAELMRAVRSLVTENRQGIAQWAARALPRLPRQVRQTNALWLLAIGAAGRLSGHTILEGEPPKNFPPELLRAVLPDNPSMAQLGVRLLEGGIEFGEVTLPGAKIIRVPQVKPLVVDVSWSRHSGSALKTVRLNLTLGVGRIVTFDPLQTEDLEEIKIRTTAGEEHTLRPVRVATVKPQLKTAMISGTFRDLAEHRQQAIEACLRMGIYPLTMEELPPSDASGMQVAVEMVDQADIFIGIYGHRYGIILQGSDVSLSELEFNRALERKQSGYLKEILVFVMHPDHPVTAADVEINKQANDKLAKFKKRISSGRTIIEFTSPEDLRAQVIQAIAECQRRLEASTGSAAVGIPPAPQPYIAHPYSLVQTSQVVGRQAELGLLTDWVTTNQQVPANVRLFNLVAIGGMGKSALTWKWFLDIAPHQLPDRAGWMWWSFYESDASFESFIIHALAYASGQTVKVVRELRAAEREDQLWQLLDERPFVLVLDGLERILIAYARLDASQMLDDDLDERTANQVATDIGLPESARQSFRGKHELRLTADARAGQFLRRLARLRASRLLISTRLYPADLQSETGDPLPGCFATFLQSFTDDDALNLWREFKVSGSREQLLSLFQSFGNYPLLIRALAGEVASYRPAPGDFDKWRAANPDFNPATLDLRNAKSHVLQFSLRGLAQAQRQVLNTLAAFRMPADWETLRVLLVGEDKACADDRELDTALIHLEDRGLMGWDKRANRYDLHPIVRGVVWGALGYDVRHSLYSELHSYFDSIPKAQNWQAVETLEDLAPAVELFQSSIGLERYEEAFAVYRDYLEAPMRYRLGATRLQVELLEQLFPDGLQSPPPLEAASQEQALSALGHARYMIGEPGRAVLLFRGAVQSAERAGDESNLAVALQNLSSTLRPIGLLRESEAVGRRSLLICRELADLSLEARTLIDLGRTLAVRGDASQSKIALRRAIAISLAQNYPSGQAAATGALVQTHLWLQQPREALRLAQQAWELAHIQRFERDLLVAARLHGEAALSLGDLATAEERIEHALSRSRSVNQIDEQLPCLTAYADLKRQRREYDSARALLEEVWVPAERGPYPLLHADARNVLARIERDKGQRDAAITAATRAFELAWCDGPTHAYHFGLTNARQLLLGLDAPNVITKLEAELPRLDESTVEPMPDVELNPKDEFWIDPATLDSSE